MKVPLPNNAAGARWTVIMSMSERAQRMLAKPTTPSRLGASSPKPERRDEPEETPEPTEAVVDEVAIIDSETRDAGREPEVEPPSPPRDHPSPAPSPEPMTPTPASPHAEGDEPAMSAHSPTATLAHCRSEATSEPDGGSPRTETKASPLRASVDAEQMSELGHELDHLEEIPTMSLEDFLTPAFLGRAGTSVSTSAPPSEFGDVDPPYQPDDDLEFAEDVDPRVAGALDEMNEAMMAVNDIEIELGAAKRRRRLHKSDGGTKIEETRKKLSSSVRAAVPFFHAQAVGHMYQVRSIECLRAYEKAHDMHAAAKDVAAQLEAEMAASASPGKKITGNEGGTFDTQLMIALSDAMSKVVETEIMKKRAEATHGRMTRLATKAVNESIALRKKFAKSVEKAQPYFAVKSAVEAKAKALDEEVAEVALRVKEGKRRYHAAMDELARISEEVHQRRMREKEEREAAEKEETAEEEEAAEKEEAAEEHGAGVEKEETPDGDEDADVGDSSEPEPEPELAPEPKPEPEPEPETYDAAVLNQREAEAVDSAGLLSLDDDERALIEEMEAGFDEDEGAGNVSARIDEEAERAVADLDDEDDDLT